jgi:hypothetical protein
VAALGHGMGRETTAAGGVRPVLAIHGRAAM